MIAALFLEEDMKNVIQLKEESYISPIGYTDRYDMIRKLQSHGWSVRVCEEGKTSLIEIQGQWRGKCSVVVPAFKGQDHALALQDVYRVIGAALSDFYGWYGNC